jgi:hypothetical protein
LLQSCLWLACLAVALVPANGRTEPIDTEHLFAFTIGSDVGETGEKEVEGSVTGRFAKRSGTYVAGTSTLSVEYVPIPNLRTELTGVVNAYDITGIRRTGRRHPLSAARSRDRAVRSRHRRRAALEPV